MVFAVGLHHPALLAGFGDSQLSRPLGTLGGHHDLVAQLVVANFVAHICQACVTSVFSTLRRVAAMVGGFSIEENQRVWGSSWGSRGGCEAA